MRKNTEHFFKIKTLSKTAMITLALGMSSYAYAVDVQVTSSESNTKVVDATDPLNKKELGVTPFTLKDYDTAQAKVLLMEKPGFASVYIPLSNHIASTTTVNVKLHALINWTSEELTRKTIETAESMVDRIAAIQSLLDARKMSDAFPLIEALKNEYPNSFSVRLIYANALLLNGEGAKAESLYTALAAEIPPNKSYLKDSLEAVRGKLRGASSRTPASSSGGKH